MYGFPRTIYLLSGWLQTRYPGTDLMSHNAGHLWFTLFGLNGDPHFSALHLLSTAVIVAGFLLLGGALARALRGVAMYVHLAHTEEAQVLQRGLEYERYAAVTPGWFPSLGWPPGRSTTDTP